MSIVELYNSDCLIEMKNIPDKSIDMILCDLPYKKDMGKWDSIIPFIELWIEYERIIKDNSAIVLFGQNPFTSKLILSNEKLFKYSLVWDKGKPGNIFSAKLNPLITHEDIAIFSKGNIANGSLCNMKYFPIMEKLEKKQKYKMSSSGKSFQRDSHEFIEYERTHKYPKSIISIFNNNGKTVKFHPTQKPVSLLKYLIKTYTLENEIVLDNCMGSGSTGVACVNTNRNFIGIEKDPEYFQIAQKRIDEARNNYQPELFKEVI